MSNESRDDPAHLEAAGEDSLILAKQALSTYFYVPIFLLVRLAQSAIRVGRKSYLVDAAPVDERPLYKAILNTTVGLLTLSFAALGLLAQALGINAVLAVLLALGLLGVAACWYMPEADRMVD